jgi:outer membrane protein assembly factor BamB
MTQVPKLKSHESERKGLMKLKLFLLFFTGIVLLGIGTANAQCPNSILLFPPPTTDGTIVKLAVPSGTCIAAPNQTARLRWNNNNSGLLQLFDTDEGGAQIWCDGINNPGGCQPGGSLCLQSDGNMVVYLGTSCNGTAIWSSGTVGGNSLCPEGLAVIEVANDGQEHVAIIQICSFGVPWQRP